MLNSMRSTTAYWNGDGFATEGGSTTLASKIPWPEATPRRLRPQVDWHRVDQRRRRGQWPKLSVVGRSQLINPAGVDPHKRGGTGGQYQIHCHGAEVTITGGYFVDMGFSTTVVHSDSTGDIAFNGTHFVHARKLTVGSGISEIDPALVVPNAARAGTRAMASLPGGQYNPSFPDNHPC